MDGKKTGLSLNGAQESKHGGNEAKEKITKTLLLKQQIEENRLRMLQREKEISNSKKNLEQLFTQLDRSCSGASLNVSMDVEDVKDSKIASLESAVTSLKSEKRELEMKLLGLETVQEAKENLELEMGELRTSHENLLVENSLLQARLEKFHELEDENDELKAKLDRLSYENSDLKQDLQARDRDIKTLESKLIKMNQELQDKATQSSTAVKIEDLERQIHDLQNERQQIQLECQELQAKLNNPTPTVKVASLGATKKPKSKRGKSSEDDDSVQNQMALLTTQRDALEEENVNLKSSIHRLEEMIDEKDLDRRTLQQRVELLMSELSVASAGPSNNDLTNLQTLLQEKEAECLALASQLSDIQTQHEGWETELFNLRAKCRDADYLINSKEEALRDLRLRLDAQIPPHAHLEKLEVLVAELQEKLSVKEQELHDIAGELTEKSNTVAEFEIKLANLDQERLRLQQECIELQTKVSEASATPPAAVKVSSLGSPGKKARTKRGKGRQVAETDSVPAGSSPVSETGSNEQKLNERIAELEKDNAALRNQEVRLVDLESQVASLEEKLAVAESDKRTLQQRVDLLLNELESSGSQANDVANVQILLQSKEQECVSLVAERDEIRQKVEETEAELFRLRAQHRDAEYLLNSKEERIRELQQQSQEIEELRQLTADLQEKLSGQSEEKSGAVARLQQSLHQAREELENAERELADRMAVIQKLEKTCSTLSKEATENEAEIQRLKDYLQEAEMVLAEKDTKLKTVQDELNRMKMQADADADRAALESELNHSHCEREMLRNDLQLCSAQLDECKSFGDRLESQLEQLKSREAELLGLNEAANAQRTAAEEKLNQLSEKYKKLAANYKQKLTLIQQLEGKVEKLKKASSESRGEDESQFLRVRLAEAEDEIELLRNQLDKLKETADQVTHLRLALNRAEDDTKAAQEDRQKLLDQLHSLETSAGELAEMKTIVERLELDLSDSRNQLSLVQEHNNQVVEQLNQLDDLKAQLSQAEHDLGCAQQQNGQLMKQLEGLSQLQDELSRAESQLQEAKEENMRFASDAATELEIARAERQEAIEESRKLLEQLDRLSERTSHLQAQLELESSRNDSHIQSLVGDHSAEIDRLRAELESVHNQLKEAISSRSDDQVNLEDQLRQANTQVNELLMSRDRLQHEAEEMRSCLDSSAHTAASMQQRLADLWQEREDLAGRNSQLATELENNKEQLSQAHHQVESLMEDASGLQRQREQDAERIVQLENELKQQRETGSLNADLEQELQNLRDQLAAAQWDLDTKVNELSGIQRLCEMHAKRVSELEEELQQLRQSGFRDASLDADISDLRDQLAAAQWDLDSKTSEMSSMYQQLQKECGRASQLEEELYHLRQSNSQHSDLMQEVQRLRDQLAATQWDLDSKVGELASIQQQRETDAGLIAQLESQLTQATPSSPQNSALEYEVQDLRERLSAAHWELNAKANELSSTHQRQQALEEELAALRQQCANTSALGDASYEESSKLTSRIAELERQLADLNNQYAGLYDSYGSKLFEITGLENQLADASHHRSLAEERNNELSAEIARLQAALVELDALKVEVESAAAARTRASDLESTNAELNNRVQELERELHELVGDRDGLRQLIDSVRQEKSAVESDLRSLQAAAEEAAQKQANCESEIESLRQKLEVSERSAADVQEIGLLRMNLADLSAERDDLNYQLEDYQAQCSTLETKVTEAEEVRSILETTVSYLESQVSTLQAEIAGHAAQLTAWEEEKAALTARLDGTDALNQELSSLRLTLEEAERTQKESDAALKDARRAARESVVRAEDLQQQLSDSLRCLSEEQKKHRVTMDERDELVERLAEVDQLRSERLELLEQISLLHQDLKRLQSTNQLEEEEMEKLRASLGESKHQAEEVSQLRLKLFEAVTEKEELESSVQVLEEELSQLRMQLDAAPKTDELTGLRAQLKEAMAEKENFESSVRRLEEELTSLRAEIEAKRSEGNEEVAQLRVKLMNTLTDKEDLEVSVQTLEEELASLRLQMESGHQATTEESLHLRAEIGQLSAERDHLSSTVQMLEDELATLRLESSTGHNSTVELTARCADLDMERNLLMEKCIELKDGHAVLEARCGELERQKMEAEAQISRLQTEHSASQESQVLSADKLSELSQLRVAVMDLSSERDDLQEKLAEAEEKMAELTALQISNSELSMELDEAHAKLQMIEDERLAEAAELKKQLSEAMTKLSQQEQKMDRVSVERDQLQQAVLRMESRTEEILVSSGSASEVRQEPHESGSGDVDVAVLKKRITELEQELHETKIKAAKSLRQVKLLRAEVAKQQKATSTGGEDYFNSAVEEELRKQVAAAEKTTADKLKEIASLLQRIDMLEAANERFLLAKERQDNEMALLQQRNRELLAQMSSLEWDSGETSGKNAPENTAASSADPPPPSSSSSLDQEQIAALESTISQLTEDNEHFQDVLDELKAERMAAEAELKARIASLEADLAEKTRLLDEVSQQMDNKDRLLSDAYESVTQLRKQVMQLSEQGGSSAIVEELKRENENLVDMIRQLSTTGTLDAATVQRLKDEIAQNAVADHHDLDQQLLNQSSSSEAGELGNIDWHSAFNDLQIEVEYLRSQNAALLNRLQEAGLVWDEEGGDAYEDGDRTEMLRLQLDNAIRNVHEREMRCQELTWEITKLLEERDTLQLRLSNSLRQNHEMQQELKDFAATANSSESDIAAKLRELKQLNYSLDVQLRREQEERQTIERQLMALYGTRGGSTSPYANGSRSHRSRSRQHNADESSSQHAGEADLDSSRESLGTGQVLSDWLKGKGSIQHV